MINQNIDDEDGLDDKTHCPYCKSISDCEHVLLVVDCTFRIAEGGHLMDAFNDRWHAMFDGENDDFDEREPFAELLEEVDSLSDFSTDFDHHGAPGMSSTYEIYYVQNKNNADKAIKLFKSENDL